MRRSIFPLIVFLLGWVIALPGAHAQEVTIKSAMHDGYGRMVITADFPIPYESSMEGGSLFLQFGQPVNVDYGPVVRRLGKYLRNATPGEGGLSVRFGLKGAPGLRSFHLGSSIVVDLLDDGEEDEPVAAAPAASARTTAPRIGVRVGEHKDFSRVVFDWPRAVNYQVDGSGSQVTLRFERAANLDLNALRRDPPRHVKGAKATTDGDASSVTLTLADNVGIKHFLSGPKVVLDIAPGLPPLSPVEAQAEKPPEPAPESAPKPEPEIVAEAPKAPQPDAEAPAAEPAVEQPAEQPAESVTPAPTTMPETEPAPEPASEVAGTPAEEAKPTPLVPTETVKAPEVPAEEQPTPLTQPGSMAADSMPAAIGSGPLPGMESLRFEWNEPVAAALFRRAGTVWLVFDRPHAADIPLLREMGKSMIRDIEQVPHEKGLVLRMLTPPGVNPSLRRDGLAWIVDLGRQGLDAKLRIDVRAEPNSAAGARLFLPVAEPGLAMAVLDPAVGDNIIVVPIIPLDYGVPGQVDYPQVSLLATAQGVVVKPWIDDLRVRPLRQGVELTAASTLRLSSVDEKLKAAMKLESSRPLVRMFDFSPWRGGLDQYNETKGRLLDKVSQTRARKPRRAARLDLARFYLSQGFGAEALGVITLLAEDVEEGETFPAELRLLRGGANLLMAHYDDAARDLDDASLDENDEALFWRGVLHVAQERADEAVTNLPQIGGVLRPYPKRLKMRLGLMAAEGGILAGRPEQARRFINLLKTEEPSERDKAQLDLLEGKLMEMSGAYDKAIGSFEAAEAAGLRKVRAHAAFGRAELLLKTEKITPQEAIDEMENLRFAWRGDSFEYNLLQRLGQLYMGIDDYRNGLRTLRQLATYFRENPKTKDVTKEMADAFEALYLEDKADTMPPVAAIALFDEFKELTPAGPKGDEMIRRLADRLAAVDLLDRAAELLESQVQYRLKGEEKAKVGARLALVYILSKQPERALETLNKSGMSKLSPEVAAQRLHLRARAMSDQGETEEALNLLVDDKSIQASLLRAAIHWETRRWASVAKSLQEVLVAKGVRGRPEVLPEEDARTVLNLAVALNLGGNERALERSRENFQEAMDISSFKDAFRLITSPDPEGLVDYRTIADKVQEGQNFQAFMASYKERLKQGELSEIN
ncbi:hypothetical protein [Magnetospira sp. QH-2]|uniref:hypothetical protein n=1 Tax=Magnetospira sp. (strain QH-2) TaxID=1288970 RepID=UPI0003E80EE7|nr:hypothetical protein [Magnetospira sp. QH-2]CCQ74116.1 Conserved exported protein of unknown function [Magnetospira sp. QH-2]